jgi:NAD+ synthetase
LKIALVQLNPTIGDVSGNTERIVNALSAAKHQGARLVIFPEQAIIGYPARDLLMRQEVIQRNVRALHQIAEDCRGIAAIVGYAEPNPDEVGRPIYNTAALLHRGEILGQARKRLLPTYDVFDEARYFQTDGRQPLLEYDGLKLGVSICEDLLREKLAGRELYEADPIADLVSDGAELVINISASPFVLGKHRWRVDLMQRRAREVARPILYVNQIGGNDDLLFDGASCIIDARGERVGQAQAFAEDTLLVDTDDLGATRCEALSSGPPCLHDALVMGLRDYMRKCHFKSAVIGLSGGIDSAVTAALAVAALGKENVRGAAMPSRYSSEHSVTDARQLAENLEIDFSVIPIEPMVSAFENQLEPVFGELPPDITEENVQARSRGVILMALSNKFGSLLLTTGNKSELAVGYCTLYGDMAGGLAILSDVPKTMVYHLARHINDRAQHELIPENTITKPPSAELKPDQKDQDTLPSYEELDAILERYEERFMSLDDIIAEGFDADVAERVVTLLQRSEYKRQQAAPGLKVTTRAFGSGRRMPIAARPPR